MIPDTEIIQDSYWVIPGRLMAGEYPGARAEPKARQRIRWLLQNGVDFFLDLTVAGESGLIAYAPILLEEAKAAGVEAVHRRMAIQDMSSPEPAQMIAILDVLEAALAAGRCVYVHCYGGIGRTGTVVGCWQARQGLPGRQALTQIALWRRAIPNGDRESPETEDQRALVLGWQPGR